MSLLARLLMFILSILACVIPTAVYVLLIWRLDRYEKEPLKLVIASFLWGALPAILIAIIASLIVDAPLAALSGSYAALVSSSLVAPVVEELAKGLAIWMLYRGARHEFDDALDGIIYASIVGLGFAMTENFFYFWGALDEGGLANWGHVVFGRAFVFGFNHAMYTSFTGIGFGLARYAKTRQRRRIMILMGLLAAILAHLLHNFMLSATGGCLVSFVIDWLGVAVVLALAMFMGRREKQWIDQAFAGEVAGGVLNAQLAHILANPRSRLERQIRALGSEGLGQAKTWRRLADAATNLALKKHQLESMGEEQGNSETIAALRRRILRLRRILGDTQVDNLRGCSDCGFAVPQDIVVCPHCGATQQAIEE